MTRTWSAIPALAAVAVSFACGDILDLGASRELWPAEAGPPSAPGAFAADATSDAVSGSFASDASAAETSDSTPAAEAEAPLVLVDTSFPAVGFVTGIGTPVDPTHPNLSDHANERTAASTLSCSGALIGPRLVLTSASCFAGDGTTTRFALNPTGDGLGHPERTIVYAVDHAYRSQAGDAILHLTVGVDQPAPDSLAAPLITMTADDGISSPFGWHANAPPDKVLASAAATVSVTWGVENATTVVRRARNCSASLVDPSNLQLTPERADTGASALGSPALTSANGGWEIIGTLYQSNATTLMYHPSFATADGSTFASAEGEWLESILWLQDEAVIPGLQPAPPLGAYTWAPVSRSPQDPVIDPAPVNFYVAGSETLSDGSTRALGICATWYSGEQIPGKYYVDGGCTIGWNANEQWVPAYKVLSVSGSTSWPSAAGGIVPPGSFASGYVGDTPLYSCRASYVNGTHPGVVGGGTCHVQWGGKDETVSSFETLVLGQ